MTIVFKGLPGLINFSEAERIIGSGMLNIG